MFEGTEDIERPPGWITRPKGPSAGQSTMFVLLDMFLGINHLAIASEFQTEMLIYMPRQHREMVKQFKKKLTMSVNDFIKGNNFSKLRKFVEHENIKKRANILFDIFQNNHYRPKTKLNKSYLTHTIIALVKFHS